MLLVVGLGNPGPEYHWTPHNAGFLAIDRLADRAGVVVANRRAKAQTARILLAGSEVALAKPETFMNLSGLAVAALVAELGVDPERELLVLYDELALPLGSIRVRPGGSAAGHNGAKSINGALRTENWPRIRIGVGPEPGEEHHGRRGAKYLLEPMRRAELDLLADALDRTAEAVETVARQGVAAAMNKWNSRGNTSPAAE